MGWSLSLGRISGIKVRIHATFLMLLGWIGLTAWNAGGPDAAGRALAYIVLLFACVVAHEFGHILVARRFGAQTEDVILLPIGGVARMRQIPEKPMQELAVALAGPAVNVVIAGVIATVFGPAQLLAQINGSDEAMALWAQLAAANLVLAVFNLLPAFPMDGGRALRALLALRMGRAPATGLAARIGHVLAFGMGAYGLMAGMPLLMLVAVFIYMGASAENANVQAHAHAEGMSVADAMLTRMAALPADARLSDAVVLLAHSPQRDIPLVDAMGKPIGLVMHDALVAALHAHGGDYPAIQAMRDDIPVLDPRVPLDDALHIMERDGLPAVFVIDRNGAMAGVLTLENLGQMLMFNRLSHRRQNSR